MAELPTGTEQARPVLPSKDLSTSRRFYETLGFRTLLDGDVIILGIGASSFVVQGRYDAVWAENCMMQLMVDDLDGWWRHIAALDLPARFGVPDPRPPALQPWGLRVAFLVDPSGVLWHVAERRAGNPAD